MAVIRRVGVLLTLLTGLILGTGASAFSECPSEEWELDEEHNRCLWLSKTGLDYDSAREDCRSRAGHLTTPDKTDILQKSFGSRERRLSFWTEYLLVLHGPRYRLFDGSGTEVELSSCGECQSLLDQSSEVRNQSVTRVCAYVTANTFLTWTTTDCQQEHSFVCHRTQNSEHQPLAPRDIAAIAVGAFILLSFFVTLSIDFYLHVKREKQKYVNSTKPDLDHEKTPPLDFSVTNFGSKVELIPTNAFPSNV
ncbi:uncharacterized protein LOC135469150 [Liolophura sinensis]|uniref:uncharacterized protein LOC135469150 n=1 Tax=Liolophura sinensis TaxID=3198878 RepID=UPI003157F235